MSEAPLNLWFNRDVRPIWEKHLLPIRNASSWPRSYLEIGVAAGDSMAWVLEHLTPDRCVGVDPYMAPKKKMQAKYDLYRLDARRRFQANEKVVLVSESSQTWLLSHAVSGAEPYDFVYVDGDHEGVAALTDMIMAWRILGVGGIMVVDDIHRRWHRGHSKVREAWKAWQDVYEDNYSYIYREAHQAAVRKVRA